MHSSCAVFRTDDELMRSQQSNAFRRRAAGFYQDTVVSSSKLQPAQEALPPQPPSPEDFGVSPDLPINLNIQPFREVVGESEELFTAYLGLSIAFLIAVVMLSVPTRQLLEFLSPSGLLLTAFVFAPLGSVCAAFIAGLLVFLVPTVVWLGTLLGDLARIPNLVGYLRYRYAFANYIDRRWAYEAWERKQTELYWYSLTGTAFEREVGKLFSSKGYEVSFTTVTGDGGVDLVLIRGKEHIVVQCKAHANKVGIGVARELFASRSNFAATGAILVASTGVTKPTSDYCREHNISVLTVNELLVMQSSIGPYRELAAVKSRQAKSVLMK